MSLHSSGRLSEAPSSWHWRDPALEAIEGAGQSPLLSLSASLSFFENLPLKKMQNIFLRKLSTTRKKNEHFKDLKCLNVRYGVMRIC